jgi:molybdenum cofactor cytidylyltransferase
MILVNSGILILAAGSGRRFGSDKRLAALPDGSPMLETATRHALASGLPVAVCLRPGEDTLAAALNALGAEILSCPGAAAGMGQSLAEGIARITWDGALVALGDMPDILPATFCKAAARLVPGGICQPTWQGKPGHPVGFSRAWFAALGRLEGDTGARAILQQNGQAITRFTVDDPGILRDIDTPEDLVVLR